MSFEIIAGLFCLLTGIVLMFWLNYKVHLKVSGLESDCRIIRSQIKLNSETVKYDLTLIVNYTNELDSKVKQLESKIIELECVNMTKQMNRVSEEFQQRKNRL